MIRYRAAPRHDDSPVPCGTCWPLEDWKWARARPRLIPHSHIGFHAHTLLLIALQETGNENADCSRASHHTDVCHLACGGRGARLPPELVQRLPLSRYCGAEETHAADQDIGSCLSSEPFQPLDVPRHVPAPTEKHKR